MSVFEGIDAAPPDPIFGVGANYNASKLA